MPRKESFTARRRRQLARQVAALEKLESRNSIGDLSSPLGMAYQAIGAVGLYHWLTSTRDEAVKHTTARTTPKHQTLAAHAPAVLPITAAPAKRGKFAALPLTTSQSSGDWLTLSEGGHRLVSSKPASFDEPTALLTEPSPSHNQPQNSAPGQGGGGSGGGGGGGGGIGASSRGAITPLRIPPPGDASTAPVVPPIQVGPSNKGAHPVAPAPILVGPGTPGARTESGGDSGSSGGGETQSGGNGGGGYSINSLLGGGSGGLQVSDAGLFEVEGADSSVALGSFTNFKLYTLDYNYGTILFPGFVHSATLGAAVDLRAQVAGDAADSYTYSWDTSDINSLVDNLSATNTYKLTFKWKTNHPVASTNTVTLTVTNGSSETEVQTYSFRVPAGSVGSGGGSGATWPEAIGGDLLLSDTPAFMSHYGLVDSSSGAFGTTITLPAYSPNYAGLVFSYDSLAADARPIVIERHTLDAGQSVPTKTSASLTFNGTAGTTYYYDTSVFTPGDIQQIPLQADATALSTGRYDYTVTVADYRSTTTTTTVTGKYNLINEGSSAFGAGWTLEGLARIYEVTGGAILSLGSGARSLWFSGGSGGSYTTPKGDFSTLSKTGSGGSATFTRTLKDGTKQRFNSSGYMTAFEDRNGLRVTYTYDGSNKITSITDAYSKITTIAYDGSGKLQTVTDTAGRVATFTVSSGKLTGVTLPDGSTWGYGYDASKRLTQITDSRSKLVTVSYNAAGRVDQITRPDGTTQTFEPYQMRGFDTSGTSGSPAPALLFAEARGTHTDPNGNASDVRIDWNGFGHANQTTDPVGNVWTGYMNSDSNGLATTTIDRLNRIGSYAYDSKGNPTTIKLPDLNLITVTYNGNSQVTEYRNELGNRVTYTYDGEGNLTNIKDSLSNLTTLTYTANGFVESVKDARSNIITYQYDSQDRLTTITHPGGATTLLAYDSKGNVATVTNERGYSQTYSHDAMNRLTGSTDALGNKATYTFDSGGNLTVAALPTPSGQTARTTSYAYDSMNRVTTISAPMSRTTVVSYDSGGRMRTVTDPVSRVSTYNYDTLDRVTSFDTPQEGSTVRHITLTYLCPCQLAPGKKPALFRAARCAA